AYVFLLVEALTHAGTSAGLPPELAAKLARATVSGSGELLDRSPLDPATLRQNVTSPGGTTAAALDVLMAADGLEKLMKEAVLAEHPIERIDLAEIAKRAEVSLADLRGEFSTTVAILAAHMKEVDRAVLRGGDGDMAEEPERERLFDVLMRRLEAHAPHREA